MSLEDKIDKLNGNFETLIGILSKPQLGGALISEETVNTGATETAKAPARSRAPKKEAAPAETPPPAQPPQKQTFVAGDSKTTAAPTSGAPTYDDVKAITLKLGEKKTRDDVVNLMAKYGATKGPELKQVDYANYINDAKALLGETTEESLV